jgi:hypothetical protein
MGTLNTYCPQNWGFGVMSREQGKSLSTPLTLREKLLGLFMAIFVWIFGNKYNLIIS